MRRFAPILAIALACTLTPAQTLKTRWAATVTPQNAWREYPRPQMVRKNWVNLNGLWKVAFTNPRADESKITYEDILVPFPVESQLSRVHKQLSPQQELLYKREFIRPKGERILLHFGAVDWDARVMVNGKSVGSHRGGYDSFTFDITDALTPSGRQQLAVYVADPTDSSYQPRGKQVVKPGGIFYTPTSGIWQTVWLEAVPKHSIAGLRIDASKDGTLQVRINTRTAPGADKLRSFFTVQLQDGSRSISAKAVAGASAVLRVRNPKLWTAESPTLYPIAVRWAGDEVTSYCAFREVSLIKSAKGQPVFALNGKPYFLIGPLDQGFWPDGLYTPPSDAAMKYDLEVTKRLGFNMIRKHVKVEPERWYYWCDKMGICVLQDMPSGDKFIGPNDPDITRSKASAADFEAELKAMVDTHYNHPSIVTWVLYNEGWGQWDTARMTALLKQWDSTRLVDSVTGWADRPGIGDYSDIHVYPGPGAPKNETKRAIFLGEFGGLGLPLPGRMWQEKGWGYQSFKTSKELTDKFVEIFDELHMLRSKGLSGAVYTQTTDVETELNGFMTYDRAMIKMDEARVRKAVSSLFLPPPTIETIVATSEEPGVLWRYLMNTKPPSSNWMAPQIGDDFWAQGPGGFGTPQTPGAIPRTLWTASDIYLRRRFTLPQDYAAGELRLRLSYDDDVEVYLDGKQVYKAPGWTTNYKLVKIPIALTKGEHLLAIHCHQNSGGQYVDAGIVRIK
jgi:hypothetical protein